MIIEIISILPAIFVCLILLPLHFIKDMNDATKTISKQINVYLEDRNGNE